MSQSTFRPSSSSSSTPHLRQLVFHGALTLAISLPHAPASTFYLTAPRISYLPLLLPQIRSLYLPLVTDDVATDDGVWFDHAGVPLKWHWPIGLLYDYHTAHLPLLSASAASAPPSIASYFAPPAGPTERPDAPTTFNLTLHLKDPPTDALLVGSAVDVCRTGFMNMVKEADHVRWGSVKRVTNLRKEQQDSLWDSIVQNDFEKYWAVASKLVPLPSSSAASSPTSGGTGSTMDGRVPEANAMRSVPMRVYLPEGAPVLQDVVAPLTDGRPTTLHAALSTLLPSLFPPPESQKPPLAHVVLHGVRVPLETEVGWLGAVLCGPDGWLGLVVVLEGR